jgi:hypothetical protein
MVFTVLIYIVLCPFSHTLVTNTTSYYVLVQDVSIFTTDVAPDANAPPGWALWSGDREGIIIDGDYAKIKVLEIDYYP